MKQLLYIFIFTVIGGQCMIASYQPTGQGAWGGPSFNPQAQRGSSSAGVEQQRRPSVLDGQASLNAPASDGRRKSGPEASVDQLKAFADRRLSASDSSMESPTKY